MPAVAVKADPPAPPAQDRKEDRREDPNGLKGKGNGGDGDGSDRRLHPFIQGLLDTIPSIPDPKEKPDWPVPDRVKWLQTAANIFHLIYKGDGGITVSAAMANRFPRPHDQ